MGTPKRDLISTIFLWGFGPIGFQLRWELEREERAKLELDKRERDKLELDKRERNKRELDECKRELDECKRSLNELLQKNSNI